MPDPATIPERYHGLDLLRAVAMLLGLVIHAPLVYFFTDIQTDFGIVDVQQIETWAMPIGGWIHQWRMPVFFLLAGFFALLVLERRGAGAFARDRLVRLGLALLVFMLPYDMLDGRLDATLMHLWFLYYLLPMCLAAALLWRLGAPLGVLAVPARRIWTWPVYLVALVPLSIAATGPDFFVPLPEQLGDFALAPFAYYSAWFALGAALYHHRAVLGDLARFWVIVAALGLGLVTLVIHWSGVPGVGAVSSLFWVLGATGLAHRVLPTRSARVDWLIELSYPIYLLHILPSVFVGIGLLALGVPQIIAIPTTIVLSFGISAAGYYAFIKYTPLDWVVNGYNKAWFKWPGGARGVRAG
ncbi:MAG: acyltransferase family protein [Pseudomonadota bacterium]